MPPNPPGAPGTSDPAATSPAARTEPHPGSPPAGDGGRSEPTGSPATLAATTAELDAVDTVLGDVEAALARLDAGTYGTCEVCRRPLADDVLAERPTATRCDECTEENE